MYRPRLLTFTLNKREMTTMTWRENRNDRASVFLSLCFFSIPFFRSLRQYLSISVYVQQRRGKGMPLSPKLGIASGRGVPVTAGDPCRAFSPPFEITPPSTSGPTWRELARVGCASGMRFFTVKFHADPSSVPRQLCEPFLFRFLLVSTIRCVFSRPRPRFHPRFLILLTAAAED